MCPRIGGRRDRASSRQAVQRGAWLGQSRTRRYVRQLRGNPTRYVRYGVLGNVPILSDRRERAVKWAARALRHTSDFVSFQCSLCLGRNTPLDHLASDGVLADLPAEE